MHLERPAKTDSTTTNENPSSNGNAERVEARIVWLTPDVEQDFRTELRELRFGGSVGARPEDYPLPDADLIRRMAEHFVGVDDLSLYLEDFRVRRPTITFRKDGYGFFLADSPRWQARRQDAIRDREEREKAQQRFAPLTTPEIRTPNITETCGSVSEQRGSYAGGKAAEPEAIRCSLCGDLGTRSVSESGLQDWCSCARGLERSAKEPDFIDRWNRHVIRAGGTGLTLSKKRFTDSERVKTVSEILARLDGA